MKKEKLNNDLYKIHLKATQEWGNTWYTILNSIHESINQELELLYHENICYGRTVTNATTKNCATGGYRSELLYARGRCFTTMCYRGLFALMPHANLHNLYMIIFLPHVHLDDN